jgi:hypothetical protein
MNTKDLDQSKRMICYEVKMQIFDFKSMLSNL